MMNRSLLTKWAGTLVIMAGGSATVFGLMLVMNGMNGDLKKPEAERAERFVAAPKPKPPKKKKKPKPKPRKRKPMKSAPAPPPSLNSAIGSVALDLPGFAPSEMGDVSKDLLGDVQASVMTADSVDTKPKPLRQVQPQLPARLVQKQVEGKVVAECMVDEQGRVEWVRIKSANPPGVFDQIVKEALRQWQFQPATYKGRPVKTATVVPFEFELG
ncbi:energy transducer TonB [Persicimonas caeni]|nr:energy transducer TonB [Persicimonas caeni]